MDIILQRNDPPADNSCTEGQFLGFGFLCYTIERPLVNWPGESGPVAIPAGGPYPLTQYRSPKRGFDVPLVNDVPGRSEIEIHPANWASQLEGCIGPGLAQGTMGDPAKGIPNGTPAVLSSDGAFERIMTLLTAVWNSGEGVFLYVKNPPSAPAAPPPSSSSVPQQERAA
jgi:hypothetical protein